MGGGTRLTQLDREEFFNRGGGVSLRPKREDKVGS